MNHAVIIAGLGRCGTSLAMQMLHAAGVSCIGSWPDFEDGQAARLNQVGITTYDVPDLCGRALKLLSGHHAQLPEGVAAIAHIVWLRRDTAEQARSQLKMGGYPDNRKTRRAMSALIVRDTMMAHRRLGVIARGPLSVIDYELLIKEPTVGALKLCQQSGIGFDGETVRRMAACVLKSDPRCAADLSMEQTLLSGATA